MGVRVKWYGSTAVRSLEGTLARRVKKAARILADATRAECPVDTGALRNTVRVAPGSTKLAASVSVGDESRGVNYARYVHDGTSRTRANPFFTRAIYKSQAAVADALAGRGESVLEKVGGFIGGLFGR